MELHSSSQSPLLISSNDFVQDGSVDLKGRPVSRTLSGGWKASLFIIGVEIAERLAYGGISSNLVSYLTNVLHQSTVTAAKNVNIWGGVAFVLPFVGAFIADTYLGRFWTILISSLVYLLGFMTLTVSASLPFLQPPPCSNMLSDSCPKASSFQFGVFFCALYLVALGQGGHKPCLQAFGADQFDDENPTERKNKSSFFNWWYFGICSGSVIAVSVLTYIQDNVGWGVGFGIPAVAMAVALFVFLCETKYYRHKLPGDSPLTRIIQVLVAATRKRNVSVPLKGDNRLFVIPEEEILKVGLRRQLLPTNQFRFLDKAAVSDAKDYDNITANSWRVCTTTQIEEVKLILRLFPIWVTCLMYGAVFAQSSTFCTKQGSTMKRNIGAHFEIPPATLQCFIFLSIMVLVPVYDRIFVPLARKYTGNERGITLLQRIGMGMFFSILSMIVAALTEIKRLKAAKDNGLVDKPYATIPLSIFWLFPQYILFGTSDVFTTIGLQEYFYDQMPDTMKSLGIAVYLSVIGVGSFLSSILISITDEFSSRGKEGSWFPDNLNKAHLDYFYWLLAVLSGLSLILDSWLYYQNKGCLALAGIHSEVKFKKEKSFVLKYLARGNMDAMAHGLEILLEPPLKLWLLWCCYTTKYWTQTWNVDCSAVKLNFRSQAKRGGLVPSILRFRPGEEWSVKSPATSVWASASASALALIPGWLLLSLLWLTLLVL
eukprot:Gb_21680 [translate_table: standard]